MINRMVWIERNFCRQCLENVIPFGQTWFFTLTLVRLCYAYKSRHGTFAMCICGMISPASCVFVLHFTCMHILFLLKSYLFRWKKSGRTIRNCCCCWWFWWCCCRCICCYSNEPSFSQMPIYILNNNINEAPMWCWFVRMCAFILAVQALATSSWRNAMLKYLTNAMQCDEMQTAFIQFSHHVRSQKSL